MAIDYAMASCSNTSSTRLIFHKSRGPIGFVLNFYTIYRIHATIRLHATMSHSTGTAQISYLIKSNTTITTIVNS